MISVNVVSFLLKEEFYLNSIYNYNNYNVSRLLNTDINNSIQFNNIDI